MDDDLQSIFMDDWDEDHRSGIVAVIGKPNVGKSTLINAILGQKIAIVSPKPQTTRKNQLGIYTDADVQIIFVDTPGMHKPKRKMGEYMMTSAGEALKDADIILWIMDVSKPPAKPDKFIAETLNAFPEQKTMILALNKSDLIEPNAPQIDEYKALVPHDSALLISAVEGTGIDDLMKTLVEKLPLGPRYYPADQVSDESLRFMTAEIVREKIILNTEEEIPHSVAVEIIEFEETEERAVIEAVIYVERHTQKGIVIGKGGSMIKKIGTEARMELIELLEKKVTLNLRVKVLRNWRSNEQFMKRVGYRMSSND